MNSVFKAFCLSKQRPQKTLVLCPHCILITSSHKIKLWEESATEKAMGMQRGYEQRGAWSTVTRGGGWVAKDDSLCGVQNEKTTLQAERPNLNSEWRKALPTLPARAKTGKCDGITACFAMS